MRSGTLSRRRSFLRRVRVYARKQLYFERGVVKLGPAYFGCPVECGGPKADPANGCPKCEVTLRRKRLEEEVLKAFRDGSPGPDADKRWPIDIVAFNANMAANAASVRKRGHHPKWTVAFARIVDIYRSEVSRMRATDSYNLMQKGKNTRPAPQAPRGQRARARNLEDEDDEE